MSEVSKTQVSKTINLLSYDEWLRVDPNEQAAAKAEIAEFVVDSILDAVGEAKSPVARGAWKASLSKEYAKFKRGFSSSGIANMELHGDMLDALESVIGSDSIEVGIFRDKEAIKAYNHNTGDTLPKRQFIPKENQKFKADIEAGIREIMRDYEAEEVDVPEERDEAEINLGSGELPTQRQPANTSADLLFSFSFADLL